MMTKKPLQSIACVLAALLLCGCGGTPLAARASPTPPATGQALTTPMPDARSDVSFADMEYERPDIGRMRAEMDDLLRGIELGKSAPQLIAMYEQLRREYEHADSMMSLAYLLYAFDVTEPYYRNEYADLQSELTMLDLDMTEASITLFDSSMEFKRLAEDRFGSEYIEAVYAQEKLNDEAIQELLRAEEAQTLIYDELLATFTLLDNGRRWTLDEILTDASLGYDEFYRLYDAYCAALNAQAGRVFLKQLAIRGKIAAKLGYGSYAAYRYDCYGRDYTINDAQRLQAAVKKHIVPVFIEANEKNDTYALYEARYGEAEFLSALSGAAADFSPMLGAPLSYMIRNELYDFSVSPLKMGGSFTTYISDHRAPFIFSQWSGSASNITTVLHELGHFANYYQNADAGYSASDSLDLAEIDSQALTLLMTRYFPRFYGDLAQLAETDLIIDCMYALISGCMEDEFQQKAYRRPDITLEELNELYRTLAIEYGLDEVYGYCGTEWVLISHTFQTPMYYISYAVSMVPSLELYGLNATDPARAKTAYFNILTRSQYARLEQTLEENGLGSVFSEATIQRLGKFLRDVT